MAGAIDALRFAIEEGNLDKVIKLTNKFAYTNSDYNNAIDCAVENGNIDIVKYIIECISDFTYDGNGFSISTAVDVGRLDIVKYLVENNSDINYGKGRAIRSAVKKNDLEIVKYLIENGANIAIEGYPILNCARSIEMIDYLVDSGADIHCNNDVTIISAAKDGRLDIIEHLIKLGINLNDKLDEILKIAVYSRNFDLVKYAIDNNADVSKDEEYLLKHAALNGYTEIIKCLVEAGADIHIENNMPIRNAIKSGSIETVIYLKDKGSVVDSKGDGALYECIIRGYNDILQYLIESGTTTHKESHQPIGAAIEYNNIDVVKYLIEQGASACDGLQSAIYLNRFDIVRLIVDNYLVLQNIDNLVYLVQAIDHRDNRVLKYLVDNGINVNVKNDFAIQYATMQGNFEAVKCLVEKGANLLNNSLVSNACEVGHGEMAAYLISNGARHKKFRRMEYNEIIDYVAKNSDTSLVSAVVVGSMSRIKYLIDNGADIHVNRDEPLRVAALKGDIDLVKYLVDHGATVIPYHKKNSSIRAAKDYGHTEILSYLQSVLK